ELSAPRALARAYYLEAKTHQHYQRWEDALASIENALKLDRRNSDYLYESYSLQAKLGESVKKFQATARMFYFLSEGEKLAKAGDYGEALVQFLSARQANSKSPIPLLKAGDMFVHTGEIVNAQLNFQKAAALDPDDPEVAAKYIGVLIQAYEWELAEATMRKFRGVEGVKQGFLDKAAADLYFRQGRLPEAVAFYRKAMSRGSADPETYFALGRALSAGRDCRNANLYFGLGLRLDPLNADAAIQTARCTAATESIDHGINQLRDTVKRNPGATAALLSAIAELQIQKGDWAGAESTLSEAMIADPKAAAPWKPMALIHLNREGTDRNAVEKALQAYQSFSERNPSDVSGRLDRYRIFTKRNEFEKASEELSRIYGLYPKYPNLHFYKGALYVLMGNLRAAVDEFNIELKNNPASVGTLIALGKVEIEGGAHEQGLGHFTQAMKLAPKSAEAKQWAGYANYILKSYEAAIALYQAALAIDGANPMTFKRLGMAFRATGRNAEASQAFRKYLEMEPDAQDRAEFERFL
ncbi:MAG: tetratricopeptide repeat protein, partial [Bdellovibrionota bacterium]